MKYQNKRNGKVTANVTFDEKFKTYAIEFEDGTNTVITGSTLKRWYVPVEDEEEQMVEPEVESTDISNAIVADFEQDEDICADGRPYAEIGKEIAEQAKEKAEQVKAKKKAKTPKRDMQESIQTIVGIIEKSGMQYKTYANDLRTITVKDPNGKSLGDIHVGDKKFVLAIHEKVVPQGWKADRVRNCLNSHAFDIVYDDLNRLENLLNAIKEEN